jgi:hypothetical protein
VVVLRRTENLGLPQANLANMRRHRKQHRTDGGLPQELGCMRGIENLCQAIRGYGPPGRHPPAQATKCGHHYGDSGDDTTEQEQPLHVT